LFGLALALTGVGVWLIEDPYLSGNPRDWSDRSSWDLAGGVSTLFLAVVLYVTWPLLVLRRRPLPAHGEAGSQIPRDRRWRKTLIAASVALLALGLSLNGLGALLIVDPNLSGFKRVLGQSDRIRKWPPNVSPEEYVEGVLASFVGLVLYSAWPLTVLGRWLQPVLVSPEDSPPPKRRWWKQMVVGTLALLALAGISTAFWQVLLSTQGKEERALVKLERLGGYVWRDKGEPGKPSEEVFFEGPMTDDTLACLKDLPRLHGIDSYSDDRDVTEVGLAHLEKLTELKRLHLRYATDSWLVHLKGLTKLQELDLSDCKVSDAGLAHLKGMTQLRKLNLCLTNVTGPAVRDLRIALPMTEILK
jgi:hypothetical protein